MVHVLDERSRRQVCLHSEVCSHLHASLIRVDRRDGLDVGRAAESGVSQTEWRAHTPLPLELFLLLCALQELGVLLLCSQLCLSNRLLFLLVLRDLARPFVAPGEGTI